MNPTSHTAGTRRCSQCGAVMGVGQRHRHEAPTWKPRYDDFEGALEGYGEADNPRRPCNAGGDPTPCALCGGDGDQCNPGNADPHRKVSDWLYPVACPRCGGSGWDPNPS